MFWFWWNGFWGIGNLFMGFYYASTLNLVIGTLCLICCAIMLALNRV